VAQLALSVVSLAYFNVDGPRLAAAVLSYAPLTEEQRCRLVEQHRRVVLRLLTDTVATAAVKGLVLGTVVWGWDQVRGSGSLPWLAIVLAASLITLLPLVGVTMVWLPFAGLAWSQGDHVGAVALAVLSWGANFVMDRWRERIGRRFHERTDWIGFLLLLGVIGGVLSYGPKGLIIGPFAVVMVVTVGRAWLPLYVTALAPDPPPDDPA
jgi:predicted PurR-regulated permease PerM